MLLSAPPMQNGFKLPHEYSNHPPNPSRYSPPESPRAIPPLFEGIESKMNNTHRGLPPPAGMTLPPPDRGPSSMAPLGNLPAPPSQWAGADESMRNWLYAKAEEDRRKQEEEKTRQETLRLDQRRIEQSILRESLSGGIPPVMVPLIFAGMGGSTLSGQTLEWAQHYMAQLSLQNQQQPPPQHQVQPPPLPQQQLQQQPHMPSDIRRDTRMIPTNPYGGHQTLQPSSNPPLPGPSSQTSLGRQTSTLPPSVARNSSSTLSRLNTVELQVQPPPPPGNLPQLGGHSLQPLPPSQVPQNESQQGSSPGIFFHHWTPTASSAKSNQPPTPSGKSNQGSPFSQHPQSHLRSEYQNSPKKRKAAGGHPAPPAPTSQPSDPSPPFSSRSSREREASPGSRNKERRPSRQHNDVSPSRDVQGRNLARPSSRQQRQDELGSLGEHVPKRQDTGSSMSTSGDERSARYSGSTSETRPAPHSAGPEMREIPATRDMEM